MDLFKANRWSRRKPSRPPTRKMIFVHVGLDTDSPALACGASVVLLDQRCTTLFFWMFGQREPVSAAVFEQRFNPIKLFGRRLGEFDAFGFQFFIGLLTIVRFPN